MLKLYHHPISANSRRVWIALLEKELEFELVEMKLDGDQFQPEFIELNPFHHIPVLVDDGFNLVESVAILDYLEAKYPTPSLMPKDVQAIATVRMVEMVHINEVVPTMNPLIQRWMGFTDDNDSEKVEQAKQKAAKGLKFFEKLLSDRSYFGGEQLSLADIVAGSGIVWYPTLGVLLDDYPKLSAWCDRLMQRPSWQKTQPTPEAIEAFKSRIKVLMAQQQSS